jgi:hypothetical protein
VGGITTGKRRDWLGEPVDADDVHVGQPCDVCVDFVRVMREWVRVGRTRTTGVEVVNERVAKMACGEPRTRTR